MGTISKAKDAKARFDSIVKIDPISLATKFLAAKKSAVNAMTVKAAQAAMELFKIKIIKAAAEAAYAKMNEAQKLIADAKAAAEAEAAAAEAEAALEAGKYGKP